METLSIKATDGLNLRYYHWEVVDPRAAILLLHGLGGHAGKYDDVAHFFQAQNIATMAPDLRGHGHSDGKRGHLNSYDQMMEDLAVIFQKMRDEYPSTPLFLIGHSYGANIALNFSIRHQPQIHGLILSSTWLRLAIDSRSIKALAKEIFNKIWPGRKLKKEPEASLITRDEEIHSRYVKDPLVHSEATASLLFQTTKAAEWALRNAGQVPMDVLIMHGTDDPITNYKASIQLAKKLGQKATVKLWDDKLHELFHEKAREEIWFYTLNWIDERT